MFKSSSPPRDAALGVSRLCAGANVAGLAPGDQTGQQCCNLNVLQKIAINFQYFSAQISFASEL